MVSIIGETAAEVEVATWHLYPRRVACVGPSWHASCSPGSSDASRGELGCCLVVVPCRSACTL
eukprot:11590344-Alexandrium_andersonii.AAC.1